MPAPMVPARMARKVPISTRALPPTSSCSRSATGRIEYFTGPNSADWVPMANKVNSISGKLPRIKPTEPTAMINTSASLIARISESLANFSPNCPPKAENRKNGRMNNMAHRLTSRSRSPLMLSLNRIARISACLKMLSLKAPSSWVRKNGRKRRVPSRANCECWVIVLVPVSEAERATEHWTIGQPAGATSACGFCGFAGENRALTAATAQTANATGRTPAIRPQWSPAGGGSARRCRW